MLVRMSSNSENYECELQVVDTSVIISDDFGVRTMNFISYDSACRWLMDEVKSLSYGFTFID